MTTKQQEREAVKQIRQIMDSLGCDSYLAIAMTGVLEDAEVNIENDWACSNYGRWQDAEQKLATVNEKVKDLQFELKVCRQNKDELNKKWIETWDKFYEEERMVHTLQDEIIKLKARLYDFIMVKEED